MAANLALAILAAGSAVVSAVEQVRICTHNDEERGECRRLRVIPPLNAECDVPGAVDGCVEFHCVMSEDCVYSVMNDQADVMGASALGLWYMQRDHPNVLAPIVAEDRKLQWPLTRQDGLSYKVVGIATEAACQAYNPLTLEKARDLRSCHGEYGDLAGWVVPVSKLISQGLAENTGSDIDIVQNYFRASCAPSNSPKEGEICTACASPHEGNQCNLNDRFAHPTGVLNCLREDAADIGFVDHWTAWGAGQAATETQNATLRNMSELKAVCNDGCRNLIEAIEEDCYLAEIPSDVMVMRANDPRIVFVRESLVRAANTQQFKTTFGTASNTKGLFFSHGTDSLVPIADSTEDYLKSLDGDLTAFNSVYEDAVTLVQPNIGEDSSDWERTVRGNPAVALVVTFFSALLLGALVGGVLICFVFHFRDQAARKRALGPGKPISGNYRRGGVANEPMQEPEIGPAGIDRHGPLHSLDL